MSDVTQHPPAPPVAEIEPLELSVQALTSHSPSSGEAKTGELQQVQG